MSLGFLALHPSKDSQPGNIPLVKNKKSRYCSLSRFWFFCRDVLNNWWNSGLPFPCHLKTLASIVAFKFHGHPIHTLELKVCVQPFTLESATFPAKGGRIPRVRPDNREASFFYLAAVHEGSLTWNDLTIKAHNCLYVCTSSPRCYKLICCPLIAGFENNGGTDTNDQILVFWTMGCSWKQRKVYKGALYIPQ